MLLQCNSYINTLLNSKIHFPMYSGLLSFKETLLFRIATKSLSNICATCSLVLMYVLNSLFFVVYWLYIDSISQYFHRFAVYSIVH